MSARVATILALGITTALGACATREDVRALRRPTLPPQAVVIADQGEALFEKIALYEVLGAPEFILFDGGDVVTTRPTRREVMRMFNTWLDDARMGAASLEDAQFLLTVQFESLRGPNVVVFTDKDAASTVHYRLEDARSREVVYEGTFSSAFRTRMPGVTPEMARAALVGAAAGASVGATLDDAEERNTAQNLAAGGAAALFVAVAPAGRPPETITEADTIGAFNGTARREQAVDWMMRRNFNQFLVGLSDQDLVRIRRAVPCSTLNPAGMRGPGIVKETLEVVGYDCPR